MGEIILGRVALLGALGDRRTAGIGKTEDFGDFIKTFADGVVTRGANDFKMVVLWHVNNLSMTAGDDEREKGEGGGILIGKVEPVGIDVRFEMMNGVEGFVPENGKGAGGESANEKGSEKARGVSDGDIVDVVFGEMGVIERFMNDG